VPLIAIEARVFNRSRVERVGGPFFFAVR
jgi:hypothetical protein